MRLDDANAIQNPRDQARVRLYGQPAFLVDALSRVPACVAAYSSSIGWEDSAPTRPIEPTDPSTRAVAEWVRGSITVTPFAQATALITAALDPVPACVRAGGVRLP